MTRERKKKYKRTHKRIEFVLNSELERDVVIWEALDRLARKGEAAEFIKQVLYHAIAGEQGVARPSTREDVEAARDLLVGEFEDLRRILANLRIAGPSAGATDAAAVDDPRAAAAAEKLRGVSFKGLKKR